MLEIFTAISTTIINKVVKTKGFSIVLIGILILINLVNVLFSLNIIVVIKSIKYLSFVIDFIYLILYSSITLLIVFSISFYISTIIYFITNTIINDSKRFSSKNLNKIDLYAFSTSQQSASNYESAFEWLIISFLCLILFDGINVLNKALEFCDFMTKSNSFLTIPIIFIIIPAIPSSLAIFSYLYKRFFTQKHFYFDADKYN